MNSIERDRLIYIRNKLQEKVDEEEKSATDYNYMAASYTQADTMELARILLGMVGEENIHKITLAKEIRKIDIRLVGLNIGDRVIHLGLYQGVICNTMPAYGDKDNSLSYCVEFDDSNLGRGWFTSDVLTKVE